MKLPWILAFLLFCLLVQNVHLQSFNCYVPADIMLLLDGSDSIQDRDWVTMKEFAQQLIMNFDVAADAIHIGMVVYSSGIGDHIGLNSFKDKNLLRTLAGVLKQPKGSTNTAKGIEYVMRKLNTDGRPGVPKIVIVITDGSSDNPRQTAMQANIAKMAGVKVLAVGVGGQMFKDELRKIASKPSKVFTSPTFGTLVTLVSEIRQMVCQVITTTTSTTTTPVVPTLPPISLTTPKGKQCSVPGDIIFLMDGSDSINDADFIRQKGFVANMIDNFEIGSQYIHVGMVVYSTMIGETVSLQQSKSKTMLKIFAKSLKHPKYGTDTARGIKQVRKMMREEGRPFAPKVMVIITDGRSMQPAKTIAQANLAKVEGISIIAIGVGNEVFRDELRQVASNPSQVFEVVDFEDLKQIITAMRDLICQEIKTTTTTTTTTPVPTTPPLYPLPPGLVCKVPADIGFVLDGSDSIDDTQWVKEKNFVANLINNLDIAPDAIHAGIIVYSTNIGDTVDFNPFKPKTLLKIMTKNLKQPKIGTDTDKGIQAMRQMFRKQGRRGAPKVMIIVTDGRSRSPQQTIAQARLAKTEGIIIIAVGVGTQVFREELSQIATNQRKLFEVSNFAALKQIIVSIRDLICQVITTTPMLTTTTPMPTPAPTTAPHVIPGCDVPAEIMIMMHGSDGIDEASWDMNKRFVGRLMNNLYIGGGTHHVGYVVFSQTIGDHIGLNQHKQVLQSLAQKLIHPGRGTNTGEGIKKIREVFRKQGRAGAPKIGLLLTDSASSDPTATKAEANLAKAEGVTMFTVGIGNRINRGELADIATTGKQLINVPTYRQLDSILPELRHMICDAITNPITPAPMTTPAPPTVNNFTKLCSGCLYDQGVGFNPFPGDCSKYVQCWTDMGQVRGVVKSCPFGQFWDAEAITCRPSMNVNCPQDHCRVAPNGFSYRMSGMGCRSYWLCLNGHSVGSCCPPGSYYVNGMGCMRGMACREPCPPDGGLIITPNCHKEESWDERYYIETVPNMGKVVRPCAPGTKFSRAYCTCVANIDGLIPIMPGDKCRASAYFNFDFDMKDKSGRKTTATVQNVGRTMYGTAHFTGRNSAILMQNFAGADLGDKLVIQLKFKFDRWGDDFDYGGLIADMGKGDFQWRWDIDAGWTRNITIGGGWDAEKLMKMFRRLFAAQTELEMNEIMIEIAYSPDFRALLYQLGFIPEATNGLQILRILISGHGSALIQSIMKRLGNVKGSESIRRLLFNLLQIEDMSKWIKNHTGKHHGHALQNWRKFLNSLKMPQNRWNKGQLWEMGWDIDIHGGTMDSRAKLIADLWRIFVKENGMDTKKWKDILKFTFMDDSGKYGVNGYLNVELMDEIHNILKGNNTVKHLWNDFLNNRNISVSWYHNGGTDTGIVGPTTLDDWLNQITGHGRGVVDFGPGELGPNAGFTEAGIKSVADLWRNFVTEMQLDKDGSLTDILRWTFAPDNQVHSAHNNLLLVNELKHALADDNIRHHWLNYLKNKNRSIQLKPSGWDVVTGSDANNMADWFYWLFKARDHGDTSSGGLTNEGIKNMADIWRTFVTQMQLDQDGSISHLLKWTLSGQGVSDAQGKQLLIDEMKALLEDGNIRNTFQDFLQMHDLNVVSTGSGWDVVKGGGVNDIDSWLHWLQTAHGGQGSSSTDWIFGPDGHGQGWWDWNVNGHGQGTGDAGFAWWDWISNGEGLDQGIDIGTGLGHAGSSGWDWNFGGQGNTGTTWWDSTSTSSGIHGASGSSNLSDRFTSTGIQTLSNLWRQFIMHLNLNQSVWQHALVWTNSHDQAGNLNLLMEEMRAVLSIDAYLQKWTEFLKTHNFNMVFDSSTGVWDTVQGGNQDHTKMWVYWLFMTKYNQDMSGSWILNAGFTAHGIQSLSNLWRQFIANLNLNQTAWQHALVWTNSQDQTGSGNRNLLLLEEMRAVLSIEIYLQKWIQFLKAHNFNMAFDSSTGLWDVVQGGNQDHMQMWIYWLFMTKYTMPSSSGVGGHIWGFSSLSINLLSELWRDFIMYQNTIGSVSSSDLPWSFNSDHTLSVVDSFRLLLIEMRLVLRSPSMRSAWLDFLQARAHSLVNENGIWYIVNGSTNAQFDHWILWLYGHAFDINDINEGIYTTSGYQILTSLWRQFIARMNMDSTVLGSSLFWTLNTDSRVSARGNLLLLVREMKAVLSHKDMLNAWIDFLHEHTYNIVYTRMGWDLVSGGSLNNVALWTYWLFESLAGLGNSNQGQIATGTYDVNHHMEYHGAYTEKGFRILRHTWHKFIVQLLSYGVIEREKLTWSFEQKTNLTDRDIYNALTLEMQNILSDQTFSEKWREYLNFSNLKILFNNGAWDVDRGMNNMEFFIWLIWILASMEEPTSFGAWNSYHSIYNRVKRDNGKTGSHEQGDLATPIQLNGLAIINDHHYLGFGGSSSGGKSSGSSSADVSIESLDHILGSLSTGYNTNSGSALYDSAEYHYGSYGPTDYTGLGLWGLRDVDFNSFGSSEEIFRKKRAAVKREKRQISPTKFDFMSLLGNCGSANGQPPSIDISANERFVRMSLMTEGRAGPATIELPIIPSWNKVTLIYDGKKMTGINENWRGKQQKETNLTGKIQRRPDGIALGSCSLHQGLKGQIDDFILYQCIPGAIQSKMGTTTFTSGISQTHTMS